MSRKKKWARQVEKKSIECKGVYFCIALTTTLGTQASRTETEPSLLTLLENVLLEKSLSNRVG